MISFFSQIELQRKPNKSTCVGHYLYPASVITF